MYNLVPTFKKAYGNNVVVMVRPVLSDDTEPDYFFLREFIEARNIKILPASGFTLRPLLNSVVPPASSSTSFRYKINDKFYQK